MKAKRANYSANYGLATLARAAAAGLAGLLLGLTPVSAARVYAGDPGSRPQASPASTATPDQAAVISFLDDAISWSRGGAVEQQFVEQPSDLLFASEDRQQLDKIVALAFDFARADAAVLAAQSLRGSKPSAANAANPLANPELTQSRRAQLESEVRAAEGRVKSLAAQLAGAARRQRDALRRQLASAQSELELDRARSDLFVTLGKFQSAGGTAEGAGDGLLGRIAELEQSVPQGGQTAALAPAAKPGQPGGEGSGITRQARHLLVLRERMQAMGRRAEATTQLLGRVESLRQPLQQLHAELEGRMKALAGQAVGEGANSAVLEQRTKELDALLNQYKLVEKALLPLAAQAMLLGRYAANLGQWRETLGQRSLEELQSLMLQLALLALVVGAVLAGAMVWRRLTFRYVQDLRLRLQLLRLRRVAVILVLGFVLLFNFTNELAALATITGFAAAGVAFALQNVILSVAGYFFLSGRYGIKVGDRVELSGIRGDVIDVGLVKLTLMELAGDGNDRQPTGRVVVFPNSIVFQPSGNFFKQAPGTSFIWNELRLTLAPDCDYRLAEKRLVAEVDEVFARYRDTVGREHRAMERELNLWLEAPKPQSRLRLSEAGIEMIVRYPAETRSAAQIADEVTRRLLDVIRSEPGLRLATPGTAIIQALEPPPAPADARPPASDDVRKSHS